VHVAQHLRASLPPCLPAEAKALVQMQRPAKGGLQQALDRLPAPPAAAETAAAAAAAAAGGAVVAALAEAAELSAEAPPPPPPPPAAHPEEVGMDVDE
jgi:hypothetical protein